MYEVQRAAPLPKIRRPARRRKYPFNDLQVDGWFFIPGQPRKTLSTHASAVGRKLGRKFALRTRHMRETLDGLVECEADHPDAIIGVRVQRTM